MKTLLRVLLPLLVIGAGAAVLVGLVLTKPEAQRKPRDERGLLVEVAPVERGRHEVSVSAQGTVIAARRVQIGPEVGGRVIWLSERLVPGGRFEAGTAMLRIDPRDYRLAVESSRAEISRARVELRLERSRKAVAEKEWKLFGDEASPRSESGDSADGGAALALREPQVRAAQVAVDSASSALDRAKLNLQRTTLKAPFNALVVNEQVDVGQVVAPQSPVATLVGTDRFWVQVSIPVEALASIDVPGVAGKDKGSSARVTQVLGGTRVERTGRVIRLLPDLDEAGSMARVLVEIEDPLALDSDDALPLLLNSYVRVDLAAHPLDDVVEVPRVALREGNKVYVKTADDRLQIRKVSIAWRRNDAVFVSDGLMDGDLVVTSRVPTAIDGMPVRTVSKPSSPPVASQEEESASATTTATEGAKGPATEGAREPAP